MKKLLYISEKNRDSDLKHFYAYFKSMGIEVAKLYLSETKLDNLVSKVAKINPDLILIHHNRALLNPEYIRQIKGNANIIWWVNDERQPLPLWIVNNTSIDLWLVSSLDTRNQIRSIGRKAEYLIMGFNPVKPKHKKRTKNIVFTGQNLNDLFPLSKFRKAIIEGLKHRIKDNFYIYGKGWECSDKESEVSSIYSEALIGLSVGHYNTNGTYSNRVLQIMSNGALCLMHESNGIKSIFGDNVVYFTDVKDAFRKYNYLMANKQELEMIAEKGRLFAENNLTWKHKAEIILKYGSKLI
ncbi:MAG TPA: glycosyltransferase [Tenuifilaceae bacterium]|nr:glycosyltransferase [Tenuifilaceae bacterium]